MVKMIDVARHAGVSIKTVSRVLNNEPHVQDALREKVRHSVSELGYVPSATARSLRSNRTYCIHLVRGAMRSNFANALQFGAMEACQDSGYRMIVSMLSPDTYRDEVKLRAWCENLLKSGKPDGVIIVPPMSNDPLIMQVLNEAGIAISRIGPNQFDDDNCSILIDDRAAATEATEHLIALGHRRIGFVLGKKNQDATHERFVGYQEALFTHQIPFDPDLVKPGLFDFESGLKAGDEFLKLSSPPTAVFAANDDMAAGVLVAAHRSGVNVPADFSIIGFDDTELAEKMWPAMTTVRQPVKAFGIEAVRSLVARAGRTKPAKPQKMNYLPYELVLRQSTGPCD